MSDPKPLYAIRRSPEALPAAPKSLRTKGKAFWKTVVDQFQLEDYQLVTLRLAAECLDRIEDARLAIQKHGLVIEGRLGVKANPACEVEKNNKTIYARLVREIGLDAILDEAASRPKPLYAGRRRN